jgi:nicotinamidase/pyrazinamidase
VPIINRLAGRFGNVVLTQDWHPPDHRSFASAHPGRRPYETIKLDYGAQVLWPDHCVQRTVGAEFHPLLQIPHAGLVLRKGLHRTIDSYSAFQENDRKTPTGLAGYLRERGLTRIFLCGLAFDFCVHYSAADARSEGFIVFVIEDACRGIDIDGSMATTRRDLAALNTSHVSALRSSLDDRSSVHLTDDGAANRATGEFAEAFTGSNTPAIRYIRECACRRRRGR